jgi:2-polyprenyl-3-methyl-5-hydroxy-6-metoxy-1,4-benzoquinol methylase
MAELEVYCPLCNNKTKMRRRLFNGEYRQCISCSFIFYTGSIVEEPGPLFSRLVSRNLQDNLADKNMQDLAIRLDLLRDINRIKINPELLLSSAQKTALAFIKKRFPRGSTIFDIGCGLGLFLDACDRNGYKVYGLEVSEPLAIELRKKYPIWIGTIDTVPDGWVKPDICTCFFVLHHLWDPISFLKTIKNKYPEAWLIIAENNDIETSADNTLPPRHYTLWNEKTVRIALEKAGYITDIIPLSIAGKEYGPSHVAGRIFTTLKRVTPPLTPLLLKLYAHILPLIIELRKTKVKSVQFLVLGYPSTSFKVHRAEP